METASSDDNPKKLRLSLGWLIPGGLAGFLPLIVYWSDLKKFFYQGDEWAQLHQLDLQGLFSWLFGFFGENFMPVFKLFWVAILYGSQGDYRVFLIASFLLHAVVVFLLGLALRNWGFGLFSIVFSQLVVALNYTHVEILTQSIQSSNLLSYGFLLGLLAMLPGIEVQTGLPSWKNRFLLGLLALLGALSFSRGVLNGWIGAAALLLLSIHHGGRVKRLIPTAIWMAAPAAILVVVLAAWTLKYREVGAGESGGMSVILKHFYYQVSLNPWFQQIRGLHINPSLTLGLGVLNLLTILTGVFLAQGSKRPLLLALLLFFLGNAFLLALGRSHLAIEHTASWRYQYGVLLVFAPLAGAALERLFAFVPIRYVTLPIQLWLLWWISDWVFDHWKYYVPDWAMHRGQMIRNAVETANEDPSGNSVAQFPGVSNERALELVEKFQLH